MAGVGGIAGGIVLVNVGGIVNVKLGVKVIFGRTVIAGDGVRLGGRVTDWVSELGWMAAVPVWF